MPTPAGAAAIAHTATSANVGPRTRPWARRTAIPTGRPGIAPRAAVGADEEIAAALDDAADRARRRGAMDVAITALERAAELFLIRLSRAAPGAGGRARLRPGRPDAADRLLDAADDFPSTPSTGLGPRGADGSWATAPAVRSSRSRRWSGSSVRWSTAGTPTWPSIRSSPSPTPRGSRTSMPVDGPPSPTPPTRSPCDGTTRAPQRARPGPTGRARLRGARADPAIPPSRLDDPGDSPPARARPPGSSATPRWRRFFLDHAVRGLRRQGRLGPLSNALVSQCWAAWHLGRWDTRVERRGGRLPG